MYFTIGHLKTLQKRRFLLEKPSFIGSKSGSTIQSIHPFLQFEGKTWSRWGCLTKSFQLLNVEEGQPFQQSISFWDTFRLSDTKTPRKYVMAGLAGPSINWGFRGFVGFRGAYWRVELQRMTGNPETGTWYTEIHEIPTKSTWWKYDMQSIHQDVW